jgi:molecular chaperone GrpE
MGNDSDEQGPTQGEAPATPAEAAPPTSPEEQIAALEQAKKELHDRLLRTAAEFENWKRRAKKEMDESSQRGREQLVKELLPVIDNLERALKHASSDDPLATGVRMVEKQLLSVLEKHGVTRFSALGQPFDPAIHDAIQQVETSEFAPGSVAQEFASGYNSNGRLLRPAMVAVAKAPPSPQPPPPAESPEGQG